MYHAVQPLLPVTDLGPPGLILWAFKFTSVIQNKCINKPQIFAQIL